MKPSGIQINKPVVVLLIGITTLIIVGYKVYRNPSYFLKLRESKMDIELELEKSKPVKVNEVSVEVKVDGKEVEIFTRLADTLTGSSNLDVLLLHGQAFTSQHWVEIHTLQLLSLWNYKAVAVDLPGYGNSKDVKVTNNATFMEELISALKFKAPVIISPSMSGYFSLPYLFKDPPNVLTRSKAFVPVAPVGTDKYDKKKYEQLKIPTAIICGEKDTKIGPVSVMNLKNLPQSKLFTLKDAGHAAYMNKPNDFHTILRDFLLEIAKK